MLNHTLSAVQHFPICCICFIWKGKEKYLCLSLGLQWVTLWAPSISKNISVIQRILVPALSSSPSQPWGSWGVSPGLGTVYQQWQLSCSEFMSPASAAKDFTSICVFHLLFHLQLSFSWFFFPVYEECYFSHSGKYNFKECDCCFSRSGKYSF